MPHRIIDRIRERIQAESVRYDCPCHGGMAEDNLDILDVEPAVLTGSVMQREKVDPRGTKYIVEGLAVDGETRVGVIGRFQDPERYLIITVYEVTKQQ